MRNSVKSTLDLQPLQKEKIYFDTHVEIKVSTIWLSKNLGSMSISEHLCTYPSPNPKLPTPPQAQN